MTFKCRICGEELDVEFEGAEPQICCNCLPEYCDDVQISFEDLL